MFNKILVIRKISKLKFLTQKFGRDAVINSKEYKLV